MNADLETIWKVLLAKASWNWNEGNNKYKEEPDSGCPVYRIKI
jgi:hypothetical protein